jgi:hypothetical protein
MPAENQNVRTYNLDDNIFVQITFDQKLTPSDRLELFVAALKEESKQTLEDFLASLMNERRQLAQETLASIDSKVTSELSKVYKELAQGIADVRNSMQPIYDSLNNNTEVSFEQKKNVLKTAFAFAGAAQPNIETAEVSLAKNAKHIADLLTANEGITEIYSFVKFAAGVARKTVVVSNVLGDLQANKTSLLALKDDNAKMAKDLQQLSASIVNSMAEGTVTIFEATGAAAQAATKKPAKKSGRQEPGQK